MKKARELPETSLARYDWTRASRGCYAGKLRTAKAVFLKPEVYALFGSDEAVNAALAAFAKQQRGAAAKKKGKCAA